MRNLFIGYSDSKYSELTSTMTRSIDEMSSYKIHVYTESDFDVNMKRSPAQIFMDFCKIKLMCMIDAIENDLADNMVWIDSDTIVNRNVDKIWFESWRIENYPLMGRYRYRNYTFFNEGEFPYMSLSNDMNVNVDNYIFRQANFILFNKSCLAFFKECVNIMNAYGFIDGADEAVMNVIYNKYGYMNNLGNINLCSETFNIEILNFISMNNRDDYARNFPVIENNYENILIFHGNKDVGVANRILDELIKTKEF